MSDETVFAGGRCHVADLLPAYLNGTLTVQDREYVGTHLAGCAVCAAELQTWRAIAFGAQATLGGPALAAAPSASVLPGAWARIDATPWQRAAALLRPARRKGMPALQLSLMQARLIPWGIWALSAAAMALCFLGMALWRVGAYPHSILGAFVPLITAVGVAFLYGPEHDAGLEVALSTPASPRVILLSRLALVFGYNFVLGLGMTLALVALRGGDFSALAAYWVGPTLLLGGLSLLLSLVASTVVGVATVGILWLARFVGSAFALPGMLLADGASPLNAIWQTSPVTVLLAGALLLLAVLYVPRQTRLSA
jgi:hypothetical protein